VNRVKVTSKRRKQLSLLLDVVDCSMKKRTDIRKFRPFLRKRKETKTRYLVTRRRKRKEQVIHNCLYLQTQALLGPERKKKSESREEEWKHQKKSERERRNHEGKLPTPGVLELTKWNTKWKRKWRRKRMRTE
jgi:hypothetical protein